MLQGLHAAGLVHRDVKPLNIIFAEEQRRFKLIDLGACADLRTGTNYTPDESILDPTYCPPEQVTPFSPLAWRKEARVFAVTGASRFWWCIRNLSPPQTASRRCLLNTGDRCTWQARIPYRVLLRAVLHADRLAAPGQTAEAPGHRHVAPAVVPLQARPL